MKKLFCIESDWDSQPQREKSMLPLLECIRGVYPEFEYIYRTANTKEELEYCLKKFKSIRRQSNDFYTIVFCGHGRTGKFALGDEKNGSELTLKALAEICQSVGKKLFLNQHVHFDSCSILKTSESNLNLFTEMTGAEAVTGFSKKVDFIDSYALEMVLFETLLNSNNVMKALKKFEKKHQTGLCEINKFTMFGDLL
jgi:hypothetical protein